MRRYLGQQQDAETAFDYFGARYYRNVWGRFTSVDPVVSAGALSNPQLWNRYAYGLNSPLRYSDPSGLEPEESPVAIDWTCSAICQGFESWASEYVYSNENIAPMLALEQRWAREAEVKRAAKEYEYRRNVENQMLAAGLWPFIAQGSWKGHTFVGRLNDVDATRAQLTVTGQFKGPGWAWRMHASVGPNPQDFRSRGGAFGSGSLQVVFSAETRNFHIDVDKYSPYDGLAALVAHGLFEVVPHVLLPSAARDPVIVR